MNVTHAVPNMSNFQFMGSGNVIAAGHFAKPAKAILRTQVSGTRNGIVTEIGMNADTNNLVTNRRAPAVKRGNDLQVKKDAVWTRAYLGWRDYQKQGNAQACYEKQTASLVDLRGGGKHATG